ncbi:hypothetical protein [Caproiciproducens sp.]
MINLHICDNANNVLNYLYKFVGNDLKCKDVDFSKFAFRNNHGDILNPELSKMCLIQSFTFLLESGFIKDIDEYGLEQYDKTDDATYIQNMVVTFTPKGIQHMESFLKHKKNDYHKDQYRRY